MQIFINTYETYLHVKDEMFEIRVRESKQEKFKTNHIAAHKITSFVVSKGAAITTDAIALALKHNIDIVIVENDGHPMGRFWHSKLGSTTKIRKQQLETSLNQEGLNWVKNWISDKLANQSEYLLDLAKHREKLREDLQTKAKKIDEYKSRVLDLQGNRVQDVAEMLRAMEGNAGRVYFEGLSRAIPKEYTFEGRSFRPAKDAFNAMLNYAYGILYGRVERSLMLAGLDPYVGFMHRDDYNMKSLVFDFIEPYRIYAERCVFGLFSTKKVNKAFFNEITGGVSLNQEGKPVLVEQFVKYLDQDHIRYMGRNQSRANAMQMDAHKIANALIGKV
ncbi:CRISPR-associated protein Cas1 [Nitritalea halalkaliphila LW7]|uniref:CRISPR-associated endonuclease Cas1 n=1 Tax=Nitritalea halalkaliphila LW7 TaxID=1189621 RepID=I5BY75_9BACT|nr:CRISPR-associated endonuclease Cas1 [Nitritalea halalkaliphila]EIM74527.1 CRISPR-associated protein Cas1 [Nitritalea halalkaliphila LW7]